MTCAFWNNFNAMNILVPDIWLRKYLKTKATPLELKEYLSLCGPSIERIYGTGNDSVYDIEITGNRPDGMSVMGVAREAVTILPRFGIKATLIGDPYKEKVVVPKIKNPLPLTLKTDPALNPRWSSLIFDSVTVGESPAWLRQELELAGLRSLNNVVDITNYLMRAYGQPAHVFDYDLIAGHKMTLRASKKGEKLITLDGKSHTLPGDDIVIEDSTGKLIDLCGIMGGENSAVTASTKRVMLFLQTYDATHIRKTSMALGHRTEAAALFEKGLDTELVGPVLMIGSAMITELTGGKIASNITDLYPAPYSRPTVSVSLSKIHSYIGKLPNQEITDILTSLGFDVTITSDSVRVKVPSFRRDVAIDVDIIEEIARVHGYHTIPSLLPEHAPPVTIPDPQLSHEEQIKIRLRDWGYTETYTYSMISEEQMDIFDLDKAKAYTITNPLSSEWVYMRPTLWPSMLATVKANIDRQKNSRLFELSMTYHWRPGDLPLETPTLMVALVGDTFFEAKGLTEALFELLGLAMPEHDRETTSDRYEPGKALYLGKFGSLGVVKGKLLSAMNIVQPVTVIELNLTALYKQANSGKTYIPVPKYPSVMEDLSFIVPEKFAIGPLITALRQSHPFVIKVTLLDVHKDTRTVHIEYQDPTKNLTSDDIAPVRKKLISLAETTFGLALRQE